MDTNMGLFVTLAAVGVAGMAAVLGIWMERDKQKAPRYAWALTGLILLTTFVSLAQSFLDERDKDKLKEDMARLLQTMDKLAAETGDPRLNELVQSELAAQSRSNPEVVEKLAQRVADAGEDPAALLAKHLGEAEVEKVAREGKIKPKARPKAEPSSEEPPAPAVASTPAPSAGRAIRVGAAVPGSAPAAPSAEQPAADAAPARAGMVTTAAPAASPTATPASAPVMLAPTAAPATEPTKAEPAPPAGRSGGRSKPKARGGR